MTKMVRSLAREIVESESPYLIREGFVRAPYTCVTIRLKNTEFCGVGFAKCNPIDRFNTGRGFDIATGRAAKMLAQLLVCEKLDLLSAISHSMTLSVLKEA